MLATSAFATPDQRLFHLHHPRPLKKTSNSGVQTSVLQHRAWLFTSQCSHMCTNLVGEVGCTTFAVLGVLGWFHGGWWGHSFSTQRFWKLLDALQVEGVKELEREYDLLQLHLAVAPGEHPWPSSYGQVRVLVGNVRPLQDTPQHKESYDVQKLWEF